MSRLKWIWRKAKESRPKAAFTSAVAVRLYAERDSTAEAQPQPDAAEADEHHRPSRQLGHPAGHAAAAGLELTVDGDAEELRRTGADRSEHGAVREDAQRKGVTARQATGEIRELPADRVEAQDRATFRRVVERRLIRVEVDPVGAAVLDRHRNIGATDGMDIV